MTALRQNIVLLGIAVAASAFFLTAVLRVNPDTVALGMVLVMSLAAVKDIRFLLAGWFWMSPYFYPFGVKGSANIASNFSHNVIVPVITVITVAALFLKQKKLNFGKEDLIWLLFVTYAVVSSFQATGGRYDDIRMIYLIYLIPYFLYLIVKNMEVDSTFIRMFAYVSIFHIVALSLMFVYEYATGEVLYQAMQDWTDVGSGRRFAGPFGSPIIVGVFVPIVFLNIYIAHKLDLVPRYIVWASAVFATILTVVTFTRSVWLGAFLAFVYLMYKIGEHGPEKLLRLGMFIVAAVVLVGAIVFVSPDVQQRLAGEENVNFRVVMAQASVNMILDKPVAGWGFGTFDEVSDRYLFDALGVYITKDTSHVTLLTILAELGLLGTFIYLVFFYFNFRYRGIRLKDFPMDDQIIAAANVGGVIAFVVNAFLIDMRFYSIAYSWFFVNLGFIFKMYKDNLLTKADTQ